MRQSHRSLFYMLSATDASFWLGNSCAGPQDKHRPGISSHALNRLKTSRRSTKTRNRFCATGEIKPVQEVGLALALGRDQNKT
ncbi:hypothetical protein GUJ93_ZPchr0002g24114 [Zizania palustris]|uniref:Uncharacterized protein n=1 Tax=Zizania palustris TaxID=103762 RepID=A0A8J5RYN6_ZIZPA|nr:hypothetical protein GUJ93_ZPchr0002g24114 [Zizania palustris]